MVLIMDVNEHVIDREMCKQLTDKDLWMRGTEQSKTRGPGHNTWFRGRGLVDGIWVSSEIDTIGASYFPFDGSLGDHRPMMVDLTMSLVLEKNLNNIFPLQA